MARSLLAAHDIPYFVHNGGYASRMVVEGIACGWFVRRIGANYQPAPDEASYDFL